MSYIIKIIKSNKKLILLIMISPFVVYFFNNFVVFIFNIGVCVGKYIRMICFYEKILKYKYKIWPRFLIKKWGFINMVEDF